MTTVWKSVNPIFPVTLVAIVLIFVGSNTGQFVSEADSSCDADSLQWGHPTLTACGATWECAPRDLMGDYTQFSNVAPPQQSPATRCNLVIPSTSDLIDYGHDWKTGCAYVRACANDGECGACQNCDTVGSVTGIAGKCYYRCTIGTSCLNTDGGISDSNPGSCWSSGRCGTT